MQDLQSTEIQVQENNRHFFNFSFFKVNPKWKWITNTEKQEATKQIESVLKNCRIKFRVYSTVGLRDDTDFLLWFASDSIDKIQDMIATVNQTLFGKCISPSHVYLSSTRPSIYAAGSRGHGWLAGEEQKKFVIVYPFIKTREWYLLPLEKRKELMDEHIEVGKKYPEVTLNTTYSFGIDDQDFMLAFETDSLEKFQDLIMDLRETKVSEYVKVDTPMIVCVKKEIVDIIHSLG